MGDFNGQGAALVESAEKMTRGNLLSLRALLQSFSTRLKRYAESCLQYGSSEVQMRASLCIRYVYIHSYPCPGQCAMLPPFPNVAGEPKQHNVSSRNSSLQRAHLIPCAVLSLLLPFNCTHLLLFTRFAFTGGEPRFNLISHRPGEEAE